MIRMNILTLIASQAPSPSILVLEPEEEHIAEGKSRVVPIYVGFVEAINLGAAIESARFARPSTHDLMLDALTSLDATIDHVLVNDAKGSTFFARLTLSQHGRMIDLDARPSDAISLAVRQGAPIYMDEDVLERTSYPYLYKRPYNEDQAIDDFREFLEGLAPEDFQE